MREPRTRLELSLCSQVRADSLANRAAPPRSWPTPGSARMDWICDAAARQAQAAASLAAAPESRAANAPAPAIPLAVWETCAMLVRASHVASAGSGAAALQQTPDDARMGLR